MAVIAAAHGMREMARNQIVSRPAIDCGKNLTAVLPDASLRGE
jgi:hypothetical protein